MKINAHILLRELEHVSSSDIGSNYLERNLAGYTIWNSGSVLRNDTLYFIERKEPLSLPGDKGGFSFLFLSGQDVSPCKGCDCICLDGKMSLEQVLLCLEKIFEKYRRWEERLSAVLTGERSIDALCRASVRIFNNPIMVHNWEYEVIGYGEKTGAEFPYRLVQEGTNYLDKNIMDELFFRSDYLDTLEYTTPQYWLNEDEELLSIYSNIFSDRGEYLARIVIDGVNGGLTDGALALLSVFTEAIRVLAVRQSDSKFNPLAAFKNYTREYLKDPSAFDKDKLLMAMRLAGWKRSGPFFCVCMELTDAGRNLHSASYESMLFDHQLHGYLSLEYEDGLILLCNLGMCPGGRDEECRRLAYIVRENLLKSGISTEFEDFFKFPDYYLQAEAALRSGKECSKTKWLFRFEDYGLAYILNYGAHTLPVETLVPACLLNLKQYDIAHETSYYKTLTNYIEYDSHTAKAIDDLYIHRNTFKSRMAKIRELMDMNLDAPEERLYLLIIFRILERYPELTY